MHLLSRLAAATIATTALIWGLAGCSGSGSSSGEVSTTTVEVSTTTVDGVKHLDVEAFATLAASPAAVVLDVRTPEEFTAGHLPNARLLDFQSADFDAQLATLDKQATYAIYCRSGNRSGQALQRMQAAGFAHAADLDGGINAWGQAGRSLVTN